MSDLAEDYRTCRRLLAGSGSSFTLPILLLPRPKRLATAAVYAFCRMADDIADEPQAGSPLESGPRRAESLAALTRGLEDSLAGRTADGMGPTAAGVLRAVADTVRRFGVPRRHLFDLIAGVAQDLSPPRFERFAELEDYCAKVASAVGFAVIHVWGFRSSAAIQESQAPAHACGVAFQLTNILRDLLEDAAIGRIYLPRESLAECGVTEADLCTGSGPGVERLFRRFLDSAGRFYESARGLDPLLSSDGRTAFRAMYGGYASIYRTLVRCGRPVPRIRGRGRLRLAVAALAGVVCGPSPVLAAGDGLRARPEAGERGGTEALR